MWINIGYINIFWYKYILNIFIWKGLWFKIFFSIFLFKIAHFLWHISCNFFIYSYMHKIFRYYFSSAKKIKHKFLFFSSWEYDKSLMNRQLLHSISFLWLFNSKNQLNTEIFTFSEQCFTFTENLKIKKF